MEENNKLDVRDSKITSHHPHNFLIVPKSFFGMKIDLYFFSVWGIKYFSFASYIKIITKGPHHSTQRKKIEFEE